MYANTYYLILHSFAHVTCTWAQVHNAMRILHDSSCNYCYTESCRTFKRYKAANASKLISYFHHRSGDLWSKVYTCTCGYSDIIIFTILMNKKISSIKKKWNIIKEKVFKSGGNLYEQIWPDGLACCEFDIESNWRWIETLTCLHQGSYWNKKNRLPQLSCKKDDTILMEFSLMSQYY